MPASDTIGLDRLRGTLPERMPSLPNNRSHHFAVALPNLLSRVQRYFSLCIFLSLASSAHAQISLTTAVDLALRGHPRVQSAEADVAKARAQLSESHYAYVPSVTAGAGLGQSYGYSPNPPTLFTVNGGSLVYNASQMSYIRSARAGLNAAILALEDVREAVAQDTALAYLALAHDQQREQVVREQAGYANTLVTISQQRLDAGQDTQIDLTQAKLTAAQLRFGILRAQDETANDREHLARLIGLPPAALTADDSFPASPVSADSAETPTVHGYANASVAAAFANAEAKRQQARGDDRFRFRPQFNLVAQYNRYATFTSSFAALQKLNGTIKADEGAFGVQISVPLFDKSRAAKARESAADASRAFHDAQGAQLDALDGQTRIRHTLSELQAQAEVAQLQQQLAQQQLDVLRVQLQSGNPNGPQMTPRDEQNARIAERDKYLGVVDAGFQLRQAEIQLLRQSGELESWLRSAAQSPVPPTPGSSFQNNLPSSPTPQR
jgi:outer membrane protein TolC